MKKKDFDRLKKSIKQAGRIRRGQSRPARVFKFRPLDIKAIRADLGKSQSEFAMMIGVITGTYSTIFVANPILLMLEKRSGRVDENGMVVIPSERTSDRASRRGDGDHATAQV